MKEKRGASSARAGEAFKLLGLPQKSTAMYMSAGRKTVSLKLSFFNVHLKDDLISYIQTH